MANVHSEYPEANLKSAAAGSCLEMQVVEYTCIHLPDTIYMAAYDIVYAPITVQTCKATYNDRPMDMHMHAVVRNVIHLQLMNC